MPDNVVTGTNSDDVLHYDNSYTIYALTGDDSISGGKMYGGSGNDFFHVDDVADLVIEYANEGIDIVFSTIYSYKLTDHVENLLLEEGSDARIGEGNTLNNEITGNDSANTLKGFGGHDKLFGGAGNDTLIGGEGSDKLVGFGFNGRNEIDTLKGGTGQDTMVLWYETSDGNKIAAYQDNNFVLSGWNDYAKIQEFNASEDKVELAGAASNYVLQRLSVAGVGSNAQDTVLLRKGIQGLTTNEVIAVFEDRSLASSSLNSFIYK
ncbi:calcium-binding protein [Leptolyngbya sp. FACHB-16]|uniref:calcium-binding protein n=1 Tax=unclassified Leptolyngbya TaxID=2650499 RepID=UPI0016838AD5|nr:calcium-binding protein [Leptolyngbya sp. FACHB-16]MBD2157037.1 hypothetical protein [Leptolyngbya sp. FACHB-16]